MKILDPKLLARAKQLFRNAAYGVAIDCTGGFGLGICERDKPGYFPCPVHGSFESCEAAGRRCDELNGTMGHTPEEAAVIVASSMRAQNLRGNS